ncbi:peptide chain release factor N(5)-glutamine methyltransferase [Pedobacter sp. MW01-1-1]|uniref:peptide chain release factor N(5)-glutamine methyltransferase n=1 Tax=Pedobacter sp. MW01-1-1 TaxID=3383027 RepID=UPI003FEE44F0
MTLLAFKKQFELELNHLYALDEIQAIYSLAIETLLNLSPIAQRLKSDVELSDNQKVQLTKLIDALKTGEPIQHILGEAHFYQLIFKVNKNVLIPRPETEELVDWILTDYKLSVPADLAILDVGTGSGCIPIALKKNLPFAQIASMDISEDALSIAQQNAAKLQTEVNFIHADILTYKSKGKFDIIVSNPPYIRNLEKEQMHQNVLSFEPHLALFVEDYHPLVFYIAITDLALESLKPDGVLYFEINEYLAKDMIDMLNLKGFKNIELRKDINGKDRMIKACR